MIEKNVKHARVRCVSGMIVFELRGGRDAGFELLRRVRLLKQAVSLGGVHSLIVHPASTVSAVQNAKEIKASGYVWLCFSSAKIFIFF